MACCAPCPDIQLDDDSVLHESAEHWNALLERSYDNRLFYSARWLRLWWEHFGAGHPSIASIRSEDGCMEAALPLMTENHGGRTVLTLLGDFNVSDYMDALADRTQAQAHLESLWSCVLSHLTWDEVRLRHVPAASPLLAAIAAVAGARDWPIEIEADEVCPVAILCSTWEGYLQMLSKKQRHEIRRKLRRATENCTWEWRTAATEADLERDLTSFFHLHEISARDKAGFFTNPMRRYFEELARQQLDIGGLRLSVFSREGKDLAATMSFVYRGRYLLYNSGYDPLYSSLSPGVVAVALAMQDAIAEKAVAFDFLSGDEPYKYQFGATNTYTCRATVARAS